jgi:beta-glucuronidase
VLYPRDNGVREVIDLSGIWRFQVDEREDGRERGWHRTGLEGAIEMPVPASYADLIQNAKVRDHVGEVWYERTCFVPRGWAGRRIVIRFGSATHHATLWVNGREVASHRGGYLPFEAELTDLVQPGMPLRITVAVSNVLDWTTLPPGEVSTNAGGRRVQRTFHDFMNYSGIHRPVLLYCTPRTYLDDVTVTTDLDGATGIVAYTAVVAGGSSRVRATLRSGADEMARVEGSSGRFEVPEARRWEPGNAFLYDLVVETLDAHGSVEDRYALPVGIRTVRVTADAFLINGKPFYFRGFGKHEDADLVGKGMSHAVNLKDFGLLAWIGANSFRTSHYPYSEQIMDLADRAGIVVIDESPAVGLNTWDRSKAVFCPERASDGALEHHLAVMRELVARDKNHPCVVMWSVANEASTHEPAAGPYFQRVVAETRRLDPTRPVTIVENVSPEESQVSRLVDVVCVNRYNGWYSDSGRLEVIEPELEADLRRWRARFGKPVLVSEYGADTIAGLHQDPPVMFTEEFQCEFLRRYHAVFDRLDFVIGEHVWNFADFATGQSITRVVGNRKGVFTRQRQPKAAAHLLRERWSRPTR